MRYCLSDSQVGSKGPEAGVVMAGSPGLQRDGRMNLYGLLYHDPGAGTAHGWARISREKSERRLRRMDADFRGFICVLLSRVAAFPAQASQVGACLLCVGREYLLEDGQSLFDILDGFIDTIQSFVSYP